MTAWRDPAEKQAFHRLQMIRLHANPYTYGMSEAEKRRVNREALASLGAMLYFETDKPGALTSYPVTEAEPLEIDVPADAEAILARRFAPTVKAARKAAPKVRAADERPTCPECGQRFRRTGNGLAWHLANRHRKAA